MSLLVVGSVAFDAVETPFGQRPRMLGGSASHFSIAASFFTDVRLVAVVGGDFGPREEEVFRRHNIDTTDLERIPDGKTFLWRGRYEYDLNVAHTLETQLNVFAGFQPKLSEGSKQARLAFLGNIQPDLQRGVREQTNAKCGIGGSGYNEFMDRDYARVVTENHRSRGSRDHQRC